MFVKEVHPALERLRALPRCRRLGVRKRDDGGDKMIEDLVRAVVERVIFVLTIDVIEEACRSR